MHFLYRGGLAFGIAILFFLGIERGGTAPADAGAKPNLLSNGDFEKGQRAPEGWQTIDGLSSFWVEDSDPTHGRVLKLNTDILQSQAYEWWAKIRGGASPQDAPQPLPTREPKYDTLAGLDGVWFWSDPAPVEKGKAYWLSLDAKGPAPIMVWLVGYTNMPDTRFGADAAAFMGYLRDGVVKTNQVRNHQGFIHAYEWKAQLVAGGTAEWKTYSRREKPFRPTAVFPNIRYVRVLLFPFWPPGLYYVDNVRLTEFDEKP
jgi:hypothetical protein